MVLKSKLALIMAELFGAATLTAVVLAVSKSGVGLPYFIAIGLAFAVATMLLVVGSVKDVSFNPAITFGMWTARKISTLNALLAILAQFLGAVAAWKVYEYLTDAPLRSIATSELDWRVFAAEAIGTFLLAFAVAAAVYYEYTGTKLAATVGGGLFLAVVVAATASNGFVNPAVALGLQSWNAAYVLGPVVGAILAVNLYGLLFAPAGTFNWEAVKVAPKSVSTKAVAKPKRATKSAAKKQATRKKTTRKATTKKR